MSSAAVREVLARKRKEYMKATRGRKRLILDDLVELTGYHRDSLARGLRRPEKRAVRMAGARGRPPRYQSVLPTLKILWMASYFACGTRLKPRLPVLLRRLVADGDVPVTPAQEQLLLTMSVATIDRLLSSERKGMELRGRSTTKPGSLLRSSIPVRTFDEWTEQAPGFFEVDLVAHCGGSAKGEFLYTLDMTDVHTGWTMLAAMKGRGQQGAHAAIESLRRQLPFRLRGLDSDNDSAFINDHLRRYCEANEITFTRCRPYKKNDQCHVEQKNWSLVRQFIGYARLETEEQLQLLREIHEVLNRYHNFHWPMMRLVSKERHGSKVRKRYAPAKTPYERLLEADGALSEREKTQLQREEELPSSNPLRLLERISKLQEKLSKTLPGVPQGSPR